MPFVGWELRKSIENRARRTLAFQFQDLTRLVSCKFSGCHKGLRRICAPEGGPLRPHVVKYVVPRADQRRRSWAICRVSVQAPHHCPLRPPQLLQPLLCRFTGSLPRQQRTTCNGVLGRALRLCSTHVIDREGALPGEELIRDDAGGPDVYRRVHMDCFAACL